MKSKLLKLSAIFILIASFAWGLVLFFEIWKTNALFAYFLIALGISFFSAATVTLLYNYLMIGNIGVMIARILTNILTLDQTVYKEMLNENAKNRIIEMFLDAHLGKTWGPIVKQQIIDMIIHDKKSYEAYDYTVSFRLSQSLGEFIDFYELSTHYSLYEYVYGSKIIFYAALTEAAFNKLHEKAGNPESGIKLVWKLHPKLASQINKDTPTNELKKYFDITYCSIDEDVQQMNTKLEYNELDENERYIECSANIQEIKKQVEINYSYKALKNKFDHFVMFSLFSPYKSLHLSWDSTHTDIAQVNVFTSFIPNQLIPMKCKRNDNLYEIHSYGPGLPGKYIFFIWKLQNEVESQ